MKKVVQTVLEMSDYECFRKVARDRGLKVKEASTRRTGGVLSWKKPFM